MNFSQTKIIIVFLLAALIAPQLQYSHPTHNSDPIHPHSAAYHQTEADFAGDLSSARLTFDVSRLTLHNPVFAVTAPSSSEARHA